jgi:hypothetical protein
MQFSELDLIYIKFRALDLLSFPGDHQFNDMYFRKVPFCGTQFHIPEIILNHTAAKNSNTPRYKIYCCQVSWRHLANSPWPCVITSASKLLNHIGGPDIVRTQAIGELHYKPADRGFNSRWCHVYFSLNWYVRPHRGQSSNQPLTERSVRIYFGCKGSRCLWPTTLSPCADCL